MATDLYEVSGLCVDVKYLVMGPLANNVYIVSDGQGTFVVDPSCDADKIVAALDGVKLDAIVLTHLHSDHMGAAAALREATGAPVIASEADAEGIEHPTMSLVGETEPCTVDRRVKNGDVVEVGAMKWKVIETPGHTKGSICLFNIPQFGNHPGGLPVLISGDTLFCGSIGRTDFEGGSMTEMKASLKKLAMLPDDTAVLPGHNSLTTIGAERRRVFALFGADR
ncbi:MBL fold metallo-hydrolase [Adlercreutzia equolifaciens]|uniref:MBL fold metallo-hydrolase n=1 Tax=Adlercreutzia equolifaciens TaxID=446660 RepID=UPI0023AEB2E0|nr:MBL fold metallo-hydrolase [Adlercreutzia equolifaciens]MDE8702254.1 MBL fold metallo-hydrolase [Adlercreutzia equolifaciens]